MVRSYIGFLPEEIDPETTTLPAGEEAGVRVAKVVPGSPAEKGGLKVGDIIVDCQGKPTPDVYEIKKIMHPHQPGDSIVFTVYRNERKGKITVVAEDVPKRKKNE
jgi:serine protease Do